MIRIGHVFSVIVAITSTANATQTTVYATSVPGVVDWQSESQAQGGPSTDCNSSNYAFNPVGMNGGSTVYLTAAAFQSYAIPAGQVITRVEVDAHGRYNSGTTGDRIRMQVSGSATGTSPQSAAWSQADVNCGWRMGLSSNGWDITSLRPSWSAADIATLNVSVRYQSSGGSTSSNLLRITSIRIVITSACPEDADGDGICNANDNCPSIANPNQVDTDHDGYGDACDGCPNDPLKISPGICGCGTPDADSDGDGILNCLDNCPNFSNVTQSDTDGDGIGDACDTSTVVTVTATIVPAVHDWENEAAAQGGATTDCNSNNSFAYNANLISTVYLSAQTFHTYSLPVGQSIVAVEVDTHGRYNSGTTGNRVRMEVSGSVPTTTHNSPSWNQTNTDCDWRMGGNGWNITGLLPIWSAADVNGLIAGVRIISSSGGGPSNELRVTAFRIRVTSSACAQDADFDLVCDAVDNCPTVSNAGQADCDHDGIGDACDSDIDNDGVMNAPDSAPCDRFHCSDADNDGCDDCSNGHFDLLHDGADADSDGICNLYDNCPSVPNPDQLNSDGDEFGNVCDPCPLLHSTIPDRDGDCAPDSTDNCMDVYNFNQQDVDHDSIGDACDICCPNVETTRSDANCDGLVNQQDVSAFVVALTQGQAAWAAFVAPHQCNYLCSNDQNLDGAVNGLDIRMFVVSLSAGPCAPAVGACCSPQTGHCSQLSSAMCTAQNGVFNPNTTCPTTVCPVFGACCLPDFSCQFIETAVCTSMSGHFQGINVQCVPGVTCPSPPGACCMEDLPCAVMTLSECDNAFGTFHPETTQCTATTCDPLGACCLCQAQSACQLLTANQCDDAEGIFNGAPSCDTSPCGGPLGACCVAGMPCSLLTQTQCDCLFGNFIGNSSCNPSPCPPSPLNDFCSAATAIATGQTVSGSTIGASNSHDFAGECDDGSPDVWYRWTAGSSGNATFALCGSEYDTVISILSACGGPELACNDDSDACAPDSLESRVSRTVTAGVTYFIQVSGFDGEVGAFSLRVTQP